MKNTHMKLHFGLVMLVVVLAGCAAEEREPSETDRVLDEIITERSLAETDGEMLRIPNINDPIPQLGMKLFFSKSLGGDFDAACVTCHHPMLGGADNLSLPVGVGAVDSDLLGPGRIHVDGTPLVPRNAPTIFNIALWDTGLFWDSRIESIGKELQANGSLSGIRTPDTEYGVTDTEAGVNLVAAQARFPVTSVVEMKGETFENGKENATIRNHIAARIGDYAQGQGELEINGWLDEFQNAFVSSETAESIITFDNIAFAIGEYERSMVFIDNPWDAYIKGDLNAISEQQKQGATLFFTAVADGGAGCSGCHNGALFSDGAHHTVAFPQIGPGKGDGPSADDDYGRGRETGLDADRYRFRTPSLLNVAVTAPYGHSGAYQTLEEVVRHYVNPANAVNNFFARGGHCQLAQFEETENCVELYPNSASNSEQALRKLQNERRQGVSLFQPVRLNNEQVAQIVAFLEALTDPCVQNRDCMSPWIPDTRESGPDDMQLNAINSSGELF